MIEKCVFLQVLKCVRRSWMRWKILSRNHQNRSRIDEVIHKQKCSATSLLVELDKPIDSRTFFRYAGSSTSRDVAEHFCLWITSSILDRFWWFLDRIFQRIQLRRTHLSTWRNTHFSIIIFRCYFLHTNTNNFCVSWSYFVKPTSTSGPCYALFNDMRVHCVIS